MPPSEKANQRQRGTIDGDRSWGQAPDGGRSRREVEPLGLGDKDLESNQERESRPQRKQKMPFLLRFQSTAFGINLSIGSQALLWQQLASNPAMRFLRIPSGIPLAIWCLGILFLFVISVIYLLKLLVWPKAVRLEFLHPIRTNFLIAPWWAALLLVLGTPGEITDRIYGPGKTIHWGVALAFSLPLLVAEIFLYAHWVYGYEERLGATANPATQISFIGNFVSAVAFAHAGWPDPALFMFAMGALHWLVVLTTLYMRPSETQQLPRALCPLYILIIAPPTMAATAWSAIQGPGQFSDLSKVFAFAGLSLFLILAARAKTMFHWTFSLAWWGFVFPQGAASVAFIYYARSLGDTWQAWIVRAIAIFFWVSATVAFVLDTCVSVWKLCRGTLFPEDEVTKRLMEDDTDRDRA